MAWVPIAAAVAGAAANSAFSGSGDKAGGAPMYAMQNMPDWLQSKFTNQMQGMPGGINVQFAGGNYPSTYGPLMRSASKLYAPGGAIPYQQSPSALTGAMTAAAPYAWMYAQQAQQAQSPQAQANLGYTGSYMNQIPAPSNAQSYNPYYDYYGGWM